MELAIYLIHFLFLFFIFKILITMFQNSKSTDSINKTPEALETAKIPVTEKNLVKDLQCNKEIDKSKAYIIVNDEQEYYFCSWDCRNKFLLKQGKHNIKKDQS